MSVERIGLLVTEDQQVKLADSVELNFGSGANADDPALYDVQARWDGTDLDILAAANNTIIKYGNGTTSFDVWLYGASANNYVVWDASSNAFKFTAADVKLQDDCFLRFGDGSGDSADVRAEWDTATTPDQFTWSAAADDTVWQVGDGTQSFDLKWYGDAATNYLFYDASASLLALKGTTGMLTVGDFVSATLGGIKVSASQTKALDVCADDGGASIVTGNHVRATRNRLLVTVATGADVTAEGAQNQLKIATATPTSTSYLNGAWDYLEVAAAATVPGYYSANRSQVDCGSNAVTVSASSVMAGVIAECVFNGTITETGVCAGVYIGKSKAGSTNAWPNAIYVADAAKFVKFASGTAYASGVKVAAVTTADSAGNTITGSGCIKIDVAGTAYYIPFYAAGEITGE